MNVSDALAKFFADHGCTHCFTVSGAGNIRMLDAIARLGCIELIACHHEQAAAQAAAGYYRACGRIAPVIVTCGGGASNVVTGIVSAWMDSIPLLVIAGQESRRDDSLRAYGVQGFSLRMMVRRVIKFTEIMVKPEMVLLDFAWEDAHRERPGPCLIEIPMDVQSGPL